MGGVVTNMMAELDREKLENKVMDRQDDGAKAPPTNLRITSCWMFRRMMQGMHPNK